MTNLLIYLFLVYLKSITINLNNHSYVDYFNHPILPFEENNLLFQTNIFTTPTFISNSILTLSDTNEINSLKKFNDLLRSLEVLLCKSIVIIYDIQNDLKIINDLFTSINNHNIHEFTLLLNYSDNLYSDEFGEILLNTNRLKNVIIFNSPFQKNLEDVIHFVTVNRKINFNKSKKEFSINNELFNESQKHHTYFNQKLFIGPSGEIKNAPECDEIFGNIKEINNPEELKKIISTPEFQKYWNVHKDIQDVCKDCEFRYMCIDNKIPSQRTENEWYHKIECNYNPYIAKWKDEDGYKTLAECGVISNENGFSIDHDKIAEINKVLWGE